MDDEKLKKLQDFYVTDTTQVCREPCTLYSLELLGSGAAANVVYVYDGFATTDKQKLAIGVVQNTSIQFNWPNGKRFNKGLYVYKGAGTVYVSGQYLGDK